MNLLMQFVSGLLFALQDFGEQIRVRLEVVLRLSLL